MKNNTLLLASLVVLASIPTTVAATSPTRLLAVCVSDATNLFGFQPWYACLQKSANDGSPKITSLNDIFLIIFPIVDSLVKAGALVAAGMIFFMFAKMMLARGDSGKIATAVGGIRDAVIGFIICLVSVALINFVAGAFQV